MKMKNILVVGLEHIADDPAGLAFELENLGFHTIFLSENTGKHVCTPSLKPTIFHMKNKLSLDIINLIRKILDFKPVITEHYLHSPSQIKNVAYIIISKLFRIKTNVVCTGGEILYWKKHSFYKKICIKVILFLTDSFVIKENYMEPYINKNKITNLKKSHYIHNGVSLNYNKLLINTEKNNNFILFYNSFKDWRNIDFLIETANKYLINNNNVIFLIVGARNHLEYNKYSNLVKHPNIILLMNNNNREFYYSLADIFILPADLVWLNVSLLEAMSLRIPCIIPNVKDSEKIINHKKNGLIYNHMDKNDLINKIDALIKNKQLRKQLGINARKTIINSFSNEKRAKMFVDVYKQLLS
jgi:glycosyltransferase involved in cell wall biosynthesis